MINLGLFLVGYILGIFSLGLLGALIVLHRPRHEAPTLSRRRNRDRPLPERDLLVEMFDELNQKRPPAEPEKGGVDYRFINLTGLEGE